MSAKPHLSLSDLHVGQVHHDLPLKILRENHYTGTTPPSAKYRYLITGGLLHGIIGAAMWGRPSSRVEDRDGQIELTRFWTEDYTPKNTESAALARMLRDMEAEGYERCIAYASASHHEGGIYKATNWMNLGLRFPSDWQNREGRRATDGSPKWKYEYVFDLPRWSGDGRGVLP